jgi:hypothetical protein
MPSPSDSQLYDRIKKKVYKQNPQHSAHRSGLVVKLYKSAFRKKYGSRKSPYIGQRSYSGLTQWYSEFNKSKSRSRSRSRSRRRK